MIKKLITNFKKKREQKKNLKQAKKYYILLQNGALFMQFIHKDLNKKENEVNRSKRRRMKKQLEVKGTFNQEIVNHYKEKMDVILKMIESQLKPVKVTKK